MIAALTAALAAVPVRFVDARELARLRDLWLLALLLGALPVFALMPRYQWLVPMIVWALLTWRTGDQAEAIVIWAGIAGTWALLLATPPVVWRWLPWAWYAVALGQVAVMLVRGEKRGRGTLGSPVLAALYLALVLPLVHPLAWPFLAVGLWLVCSWHAFLAVGVSLVVLRPELGWLVAGLALIALVGLCTPARRVFDLTPRGGSPDGIISRLRAAWIVWWHIRHDRAQWLTGHGYGSLEHVMMRWASRYGVPLPDSAVHNEVVQAVYEYGALGLASVLLFAWMVGQHLAWGDPWSAAWVGSVVMTLGHWPLRHPALGLTWLAISAKLVTA